ncbi:MAG: hypothetical protein P8X74_03895 [Reinekea sp.]
MWANLDLKNIDSHLIKQCKKCGAKIVWLKSKNGKPYPVDFNGLIDVLTTDFHKCGNSAKSLGTRNP